jgi:hypothetical protein
LRGRFVIGFIALCVLLAGPVLGALAAQVVVPIPGLTGGHIQVAGALRTNDGGAILASRITNGGDSSRGRMVVARLLADGALSLAYGSEGLSTLRVSAQLRPTALAIDPASGEAWIGARIGQTGRGEIIALNGNGARRRSFANEGVLRLPAADDGGPVALAWRQGALLIAAGETPCRGCSLSIRDPRTGRLITSSTLSPENLAPSGCHVAVTAAVFVSVNAEFLTTRTAARSGCASLILALGSDLQPVGSPGPPAPALPDPGASASVIATSGGASCIATTAPSHTGISPYATGSAGTAANAPAGSLTGLVPLGPGSCAALIRTPRGQATVAQMTSGDAHALTDRVPPAVTALAMFRCNQHLLVVGATGSAGRQSAVIVPVPVRRGKFAAQASIASAHPLSTGCH